MPGTSPIRTRRLRWAITLFLVAIGLGAAVYRASVLREESRTLVIVIPDGTAAGIEAGDLTNAPPHQIELILGIKDILVIDNQDSVWHEVGPYRIAPGRTLTQRFSQPGRVQQACTMTPSQQVEIIIREP